VAVSSAIRGSRGSDLERLGIREAMARGVESKVSMVQSIDPAKVEGLRSSRSVWNTQANNSASKQQSGEMVGSTRMRVPYDSCVPRA
jgi:hypothetical protein